MYSKLIGLSAVVAGSYVNILWLKLSTFCWRRHNIAGPPYEPARRFSKPLAPQHHCVTIEVAVLIKILCKHQNSHTYVYRLHDDTAGGRITIPGQVSNNTFWYNEKVSQTIAQWLKTLDKNFAILVGFKGKHLVVIMIKKIVTREGSQRSPGHVAPLPSM